MKKIRIIFDLDDTVLIGDYKLEKELLQIYIKNKLIGKNYQMTCQIV